jgi:hypothetical protein
LPCNLSLTWIYEIFNRIFPFKTSKRKLKRLDAEKTGKTTKEHESSNRHRRARARARTHEKANEQSECARRQYFFYISTSGFVIIWRLRSVLSVNRTVQTDTHTRKKNAYWRWGRHYFVYISKSAFWHSTVRICLEISSDGTEHYTCKRPPESVIWSFFDVCTFYFFVFNGQILSWDSSDGTGNATCILQI